MKKLEMIKFLCLLFIEVVEGAPESVAKAYARALEFPGSFALEADTEETLSESGEAKLREIKVSKAINNYRREFHIGFLVSLERSIIERGMGSIVVACLTKREFLDDEDKKALRQAPQLELFAELNRNYLLYTPGYKPQTDHERSLMPEPEPAIIDVALTSDLI